MTSLIRNQSQFQLDGQKLVAILSEMKLKLQGRVRSAYVFGSASTGTINSDSDIDLILVVEATSTPFVERGMEFRDLFDVYPKLDLLVYTQAELDQQLADSQTGFWKSVRLSMRSIV